MRDDGLIEFYKNTFKLKVSVDDNLKSNFKNVRKKL